ncbi:MAG: pyridoxamine 5'-phosphate oxidase family protein [Acidimicrobiia bacterium]|nr:pyridoxamine 5'-phosphate oxidase family protein [Acidimicrobiia bacterium]
MSESAFEYLSSHSLLFLATASPAGDVHVAPMFYASEDKAIFFSAPDGSVTAENLRGNPVAAVAIADAPADWSQARGLQIEGPVAELDGDLEAAAAQLFQSKYSHLGDAASHSHYWRLDAADVRYVHNGEAGTESFETLGQTWEREKVA